MGMLITACASLIGIHNIFRVQATLKVKDVNMFLLHPTSLRGALDMLHRFTVTKPLNSTLPFGMLTNMLP